MALAEPTSNSAATVIEFHLGDRMRKTRLASGLEQKDMAENYGVSTGTISNWEAGAQPRKLIQVVNQWAAICAERLEQSPALLANWLLTGDWPGITCIPDSAGDRPNQLRLALLTSVP